ncbi:hypothetical protein BGZ94_000920 [Podila epigama]|nr:hypothetical protein BGZ94_000920 [Podila epigama]
MKTPLTSTLVLSTTLATLLFLTFPPQTVSSQRIAASLEAIKVLGDGGQSHAIHRDDGNVIIRTSSSEPDAHPNRFWVDFHDIEPTGTNTDNAMTAAATTAATAMRDQFLKAIEKIPGIALKHEFWDTLNSVSIEVQDEALLHELVAKVPGIKLIEPVVHEKLKLFGKGIKVGIIDTGIDYNHPALGGCYGKGCKVAYGANFISEKKGEKPNDDPMDCNGHGTHVAGIVAANDTDFIGVAPQATLGAYRVFNCKGATGNDQIIQAMAKAVEDGMDVINMSLGGPGGWRQEREAKMVDQLSKKSSSIFVIAMGNEGELGLFQASSPGVAEYSMTVASLEARYVSGFYFTVDPRLKGASVESMMASTTSMNNDDDDSVHTERASSPRKIMFGGALDVDFSKPLVQLAPGTSGNVKSDGCSPIRQDVKGKIVLVRRGDCTFQKKMDNAVKAGASALIYMDNIKGSKGFSVRLQEKAPIKYMSISRSDGEYLLKTIKANRREKSGITLVHGNGPTSVNNPRAGLLSAFTSLGPDTELNVKPEIAAPGGKIWSTLPLKMGKYGSLSGTSMATPYVAGCIALYLEGKPTADRSMPAIRAAFQNPSRPRDNDVDSDNDDDDTNSRQGKGDKKKKRFDGLASVLQQGAGLVNLEYVLSNKAIVTPSVLALNDTTHLDAKQHLKIINTGSTPLEYKVDIIPAAGLLPFYNRNNLTMNPEPLQVSAKPTVHISPRTVRVDPGQTVSVDLTFVKGPSVDPKLFALYSGYVRLKPTNDNNKKGDSAAPTLHVPYVGMHGNWKEAPVIDRDFGLVVVNEDGKSIHKRTGNGNSLDLPEDPTTSISDLLNPHKDGKDNLSNGNSTIYDDDEDDDEDDSKNPKKKSKDLYAVFKLVTGCKVLVVDLVDGAGSNDPTKVKSYGILKNGVALHVPRTDGQDGNDMQILKWEYPYSLLDTTNGGDSKGDDALKLPDPRREYRLRISLLKHFGNMEDDRDFETVLSKPFKLPRDN